LVPVTGFVPIRVNVLAFFISRRRRFAFLVRVVRMFRG
jgi:hypothetical protein